MLICVLLSMCCNGKLILVSHGWPSYPFCFCCYSSYKSKRIGGTLVCTSKVIIQLIIQRVHKTDTLLACFRCNQFVQPGKSHYTKNNTVLGILDKDSKRYRDGAYR